MIISMTGFGRGESAGEGIVATVEMRSVNNRFLEVSARMPKEFAARENDLREILRKSLTRGKVTVSVNVARSGSQEIPFIVDEGLVVQYKEALNQIRKAAKIKETAGLQHLLMFKDELIRRGTEDDKEEQDWKVIADAVAKAAQNMQEMRSNEGRELAKDLRKRIATIDSLVNDAEKLSKEQVPEERKRLRERIARLFENDEIDEQRLEMEIVLLADKLDVTEECVRYRSHSKFFLEAVKDPEPAGRRLNFLLQEMHREINTIGSKSSDARIAHQIVKAKEELEKIREQVQNIE